MVWRLVAGSGPVGLRCSALFQSPGALRSPRSWNSLRGRSPCPLPVSDLEGGKRTLESENPKGCCTTGGRGGSQQVQPLNHRGYMCGPHELRGGGGVPGSPQSFQRQNMVGLRRWFLSCACRPAKGGRILHTEQRGGVKHAINTIIYTIDRMQGLSYRSCFWPKSLQTPEFEKNSLGPRHSNGQVLT